MSLIQILTESVRLVWYKKQIKTKAVLQYNIVVEKQLYVLPYYLCYAISVE